MQKEPNSDKTAVGYIRVSRNLYRRTSDKELVDRQRAAVQAKAAELGAKYEKEYNDYGGKGRPGVHTGFSVLLYDIHKRQVDYVIVESLDRLSRDRDEVARILNFVKSTGAKLVTTKYDVDKAGWLYAKE